MRTIVFATTNPHKIDEVAQILAPSGILVIGLGAIHGGEHSPVEQIPEPVEDADTFEGNARIKAIAYAKAMGEACLADDSGLEVDALDGAPGVHSARYAGTGSTRQERDAANNAKLLAALKDTDDEARTARFVCAMCLAAPDGTILAETRGTFEGVIVRAPKGTNGFGYDPLLLIPQLGVTSAELSPDEKNARSHRGAAARKMAEYFKSMPGS